MCVQANMCESSGKMRRETNVGVRHHPFGNIQQHACSFALGGGKVNTMPVRQRPSAGICLKFPVGLRDKCHINVLTPGAQPMIKFGIFAISHAPTVPAEQPEATSGRRHSKTLAGVFTMRSSSGPEATRCRGPSSSRQISVRDTFTPV